MNNKYIDVAIEEALIGYKNNEVPIGAVIVKDDKIISQRHNIKFETKNALNHAEILAIDDAMKKIGDWRLNECEMYVTLEPCPMCAGAIAQARIRKIYIGTESNILSNKKIIANILQNNEYYHNVDIEYLHNLKCSNLLTQFFLNKR